jgi:hypothetical protein
VTLEDEEKAVFETTFAGYTKKRMVEECHLGSVMWKMQRVRMELGEQCEGSNGEELKETEVQTEMKSIVMPGWLWKLRSVEGRIPGGGHDLDRRDVVQSECAGHNCCVKDVCCV